MGSLVCDNCDNFSVSRCVYTQTAINTSIVHVGCSDWVPKPFIYTFLRNYSCLNDQVEKLHNTLAISSVSELCNRTLRTYFCNYIYPGCNPNDSHQPIGICPDDCSKFLFGKTCTDEINALVTIVTVSSMFRFPKQCDNTLLFVTDGGLNVTQYEDRCLNLSGNNNAFLSKCIIAW